MWNQWKGNKKLRNQYYCLLNFIFFSNSRSCFSNYVDYHRCVNLKGDDYEPCNYYKAQFMAMCFNWQIEKFDEQREKGAFPAKLK